jgi:hypothetical protein
MVDPFLVFVAVDICCFLLLVLLFSAVPGKDDMSLGEGAILYLVSFCVAGSAILLWIFYSL